MMPHRRAIDSGLLDLETLVYCSGSHSMPIHQAFLCGWIVGELRTRIEPNGSSPSMIECEPMRGDDQDDLCVSLTNIVNSLSEFRHSIQIDHRARLTDDGYIEDKLTQQRFLLSEAIQCGLITIAESHRTDVSNNTFSDTLIVFQPEDQASLSFC
jgi:hypothetical protein